MEARCVSRLSELGLRVTLSKKLVLPQWSGCGGVVLRWRKPLWRPRVTNNTTHFANREPFWTFLKGAKRVVRRGVQIILTYKLIRFAKGLVTEIFPA